MSDISRKALVDYLDTQFANTPYGAVSAKIKEIYNEVNSGAFPSTESEGEVTRLRKALKEIKTIAIGYQRAIDLKIVLKDVFFTASKALSSHREDVETVCKHEFVPLNNQWECAFCGIKDGRTNT